MVINRLCLRGLIFGPKIGLENPTQLPKFNRRTCERCGGQRRKVQHILSSLFPSPKIWRENCVLGLLGFFNLGCKILFHFCSEWKKWLRTVGKTRHHLHDPHQKSYPLWWSSLMGLVLLPLPIG